MAVEQKLAAVDGAEASLLFSSGMAAISTALITLLKAGDEIICCSAIYGGTFHIIEDLLPKLGIAHRFVPIEALADLSSVIGPKTKMVWFESPINPTLRCVDVRTVAAACKQAGVLSAIDNTFASPINQPVLSMGIDLSMQSCTKYLNGHSDVTGGVLSGSQALMAPIGKMRRLLGGIMDPLPAFALGTRHEDDAAARGAAQRQRADGGAVPRRASRHRAGLLPGPGLASGSRHCRAAR